MQVMMRVVCKVMVVCKVVNMISLAVFRQDLLQMCFLSGQRTGKGSRYQD